LPTSFMLWQGKSAQFKGGPKYPPKIRLILANATEPSWATLIAARGSFLLAAINLIPLPPFDGFTVVEAFLARRGLRIDEGQRRQLFSIGIGAMVVLTLVL
jgi:Zn-dependent protease